MPSFQNRDPLIEIRWSHDHLIFIMGIPIPGKTVFILQQNQDSTGSTTSMAQDATANLLTTF